MDGFRVLANADKDQTRCQWVEGARMADFNSLSSSNAFCSISQLVHHIEGCPFNGFINQKGVSKSGLLIWFFQWGMLS